MTQSTSVAMGLFERYLSLWVALCITAGYATRKLLERSGDAARISSFTARVKPVSVMGLLATVVGVVVEVPVMLSLVAIANKTRHRFTP